MNKPIPVTPKMPKEMSERIYASLDHTEPTEEQQQFLSVAKWLFDETRSPRQTTRKQTPTNEQVYMISLLVELENAVIEDHRSKRSALGRGAVLEYTKHIADCRGINKPSFSREQGI